jgi:hypothetical protein
VHVGTLLDEIDIGCMRFPIERMTIKMKLHEESIDQGILWKLIISGYAKTMLPGSPSVAWCSSLETVDVKMGGKRYLGVC